MRIFSNEYLSEDNVDYTKWETFNGDYVNISDTGNGYIERCIDMLEWYIQSYPKHSNYPVWIKYMDIFENELLKRSAYSENTINYMHKPA